MAAPAVLLPPIDETALWSLMERAEELGLRLEMTEADIVLVSEQVRSSLGGEAFGLQRRMGS